MFGKFCWTPRRKEAATVENGGSFVAEPVYRKTFENIRALVDGLRHRIAQ
jgi:hypothetical protein